MIMDNDLGTRIKRELENMKKTDEITEKLVGGGFISERFRKYLGCLSIIDFTSNGAVYYFEKEDFDRSFKMLSDCLLSLNTIANLYGYEKIGLNDIGKIDEHFIGKMHLCYKKNIPIRYHYLYDIAKEKFDSSFNEAVNLAKLFDRLK